jgi:hypothetical protein
VAVGGTIPEDECWRLLATTEVGRLALSVEALPALLPVRYVVGDGQITMCLCEFQVPGTSADDAVVAFSADEFSDAQHHGWYVHAVGTSTLDLVKEGHPDEHDHPAGCQVVRLVPTILRGRRLHLRPPLTRQ